MALSVANRAAKWFAALVDAVDLVSHHAGHDAAAGMGGLDLDVGHTGDGGDAAGHGHLEQVGVGAADYLTVLDDSDGAVEVEMGAQFLRVVVETVPVGPRFGAHPPLELVGGDVPQFQHSSYDSRIKVNETRRVILTGSALERPSVRSDGCCG